MNREKWIFGKIASLVLAMLVLVLFPTCEVGLGDAVDTSSPTLSITYPPAAAVIRKTFKIAGTCSDDQAVASVAVSVTNTDTNKSYGTFSAQVSGNSWSADLNEAGGSFNGWTFPDGNYVAYVVAADTAGRTSGTSSLSFQIDNTAPIFVLSSPGSDGFESDNTSTPTEYGSSFKVSGQIADDHTVSMTAKVYANNVDLDNLDSATPIGTYEETNIDIAGGTSVTFAQYSASGNSELNQRYNSWYGNDPTAGNKKFYVAIELSDSAREYTTPTSGSSGTGNTANNFYLYDKVYSDLMASTGLGLAIADVKKIYNKTSSLDSTIQSDAIDILNDSSKYTTLSKFTINPDASPKYSVVGYGFEASDIGASFSKTATADQTVSVSIVAGRDAVNVVPNTFKAYRFGPYDGTSDLTSEVLSTIYNDPATYVTNHASLSTLLDDNTSSTESSTESYSWAIEVGSEISANKYYVLAIIGKDANGVDVTNADAKFYGFKGATSGTPPTITWDSTLSSTDYPNSASDLGYYNSSAMTFSCKATGEQGINSVGYSITVTDESDNSTVGTITGTATAINGVTGGYKFNVANGTGYSTCEAALNSGKEYLYDITVTASGTNGQTSTRQRRVHVDTTKPTVTISSVTPTVVSGNDTYVNGIIKVAGSVEETALKGLKYEIWSDDDTSASYTSPDLGAKYSFSQSIDTTDVETYGTENEKTVKIIFYATDLAGNIGSYSTIAYLNSGSETGTKTFTVSQASDNPVIEGSNFYNVTSVSNIKATPSSSEVSGVTTYYGNLFGTTSNNKLLGTITDDDGVASVTIGYRTAGSTGSYTTSSVLTGGTSTTYSFSYQLPLVAGGSIGAEGQYQIQIKVTDTVGTSTTYNQTTKDFYVAADSGAPVLLINNTSGTYYKTGGSISVSGTATDNTNITLSGGSSPSFASGYNGSWTDTVTASGTEGTDSVVTYTATDIYGQTGSSSFTYKIDNTVPSVYSTGSYVFKIAGATHSNTNYYNNTSLSVSGYYKEAGSGISTINYTLNPAGDNSDITGTVAAAKVSAIQDDVVWSFTSAISGFEVGQNVLTITATDVAGNTCAAATYTVNVDTTAPTIEADSDTSILTNGKADLTGITGTTTDALSGFSSVSVYIGNSTYKITSGETSSYGSLTLGDANASGQRVWTLNIDAANASGAANTWFTQIGTNPGIYATVTDKAGNVTSNVKVTSLTVDTTAPSVTITTPTENATVNKTVTVKGTANDSNELKTVVISYLSAANTWTGVNGGSFSTTDAFNWSVDVDTTTLTIYDCDSTVDGNQVKLRAVATDTAGNSTTVERVVTVDQNSDRPTVVFANISFKDASGNLMSSSKNMWVKSITTLYGSVSDDDGVTSIFLSKDNSTWHEATLNSGSWTFDMNTIKSGTTVDGTYTLYVKVVDSAGTTFTSKTTSALDAVYIADGTSASANKFGTQTNADSILYLTFDTSSPDASIEGISVDGKAVTNANKTWISSGYTNLLLGGSTTSFDVKVTATDTNGISSVKAETSGLTGVDSVIYTAKAMNASNVETAIVNEIEYYLLSGIACNSGTGVLTLTVTTTDNAGLTTIKTQSLNVDNTKPVVTVLSPSESITSNGGGSTTVYGTVDKSNSKMYFALSTAETYEPSDTAVAGESSAYEQITDSSSLTWYLYFDGDTENINGKHVKVLNKYLTSATELDITNDADITNKVYDTLTTLYIWIKAIDTFGNETIVRHKLVVDPQGDRPKVTIEYPESNGETVGGTVKVYGTADDNELVESVWVQIISTTHKTNTTVTRTFGSFITNASEEITSLSLTPGDLDYLAYHGYSIYNMKTYDPDSTNTKWSVGSSVATGYTVNDYGILATFSGTSWNLKLNSSSEFNPDSGATNKVAMRVYAMDTKDPKNQSVEVFRSFIFDADNPIVSNLYLVQGSDAITNTPSYAISKEYTDDMYVKGGWYLIGSVTDTDTIKTLSIGSDSLVQNSTAQTGSWGTALYDLKDNKPATVWFKYPLATSSGVGKVELTITASDGSDHDGSKSIIVNYDNTAPSLVTTGTYYNISGDVKQTGDFYTFGSQVTEESIGGTSQSGVQRIACYFVRRLSNSTTLYDVMLPKNSSSTKINVKDITTSTDTGYTYDSGLYWKILTVTRTDSSLNVLTLPAADANVRIGGLVRIGGSVYTVTDVTGTTVTIDGSPLYSDSSQKAYFAIAQIVNNTVTENGSGVLQSDGYYLSANISNDDKDRMVEAMSKSGATWTWEANICSKNIPDGPIEIHYVAFDKAGNYAVGVVGNTTSYSDSTNSGDTVTYTNDDAFVSNNAPRIAGVTIGTDYDGNGTIEDNASYSEWFTDYAAENESASYYNSQTETNALKLKTSFTVGTEGTAAVTLKGYSEIKPEVVGGNGQIKFSYNFGNNLKGNSATTIATEGTTDYSLDTLASNIVLQTGDLRKIGDTTSSAYTITLWDSTEGTTQFTDSSKATITMHLGIAVADDVVPTATINPFHWTSSSDNSLYGNSTNNGHIELEADWANSASKAGTTGQYDADPKVSGKINITGTVKDNKRLSSIYLRIPNMATQFGNAGCATKTVSDVTYYKMATYNTALATWTGTNAWSTNGFNFAVNENTFDKDGQTATWTFSWDTSKITGVAAADVIVQVLAYDEGTPSYTTGTGTDYTYLSIDGTTKYSTDATYSNQKASELSTVQTATTKTPYYRMDVVPYITGIKSLLSTLKSNNSSVYDRTALGHYPVNASKSAYIVGFNIKENGTAYDKENTPATLGAADTTTFNGYTCYPISVANLSSGELFVKVSNVESLNNKNVNDSKGDAEEDTTKYANYYNRQPNGDNNYRLTDDVVIDVWNVKNSARSHSGTLTEPIMKIIPATSDTASDTADTLRFAFTNGAEYFSMAPASTNKLSYRYWQKNYADFNNVAFAYDSAGNSYGITTGLDTYPSGTSTLAGRMTFISSRWGRCNYTQMDDNYWGLHKLRIESIGMLKNTYVQGSQINDDYIMDTRRFNSPVLATAVHSGTGTAASTSVYYAYYDKFQKQIRFRYGTFDNNTGTPSQTGETHNDTTVGQFRDQYAAVDTESPEGGYRNNKHAFDASPDDYSLIAGIDARYSTDTGNTAGKYVSIDVIPGSTTAGDVVVAVWYDGSNLKYSYKVNPYTDYDADQTHDGITGYWSKAKTIFTNGGKYCAVKVDANGGVHIAAQDSVNQDLKYAYLESYNVTYSENNAVTVDAYAIVGSQVQIDVQKEGDQFIPYISYYAGSMQKPKMAYLVPQTTMNYTVAGVNSSDESYTGKWEVTFIPTNSEVQDDHTNIGLWKTTAGVKRENVYKGTDSLGETEGTIYGNGTANPVIGYATIEGTQGYIETAQMK